MGIPGIEISPDNSWIKQSPAYFNTASIDRATCSPMSW